MLPICPISHHENLGHSKTNAAETESNNTSGRGAPRAPWNCSAESVLFMMTTLSLTSSFRLNRWCHKQRDTWQEKGDNLNPQSNFWVDPTRKPIIPLSAQLPLMEHIHNSSLWTPGKMISWGKQYFWKPSDVFLMT